MFLKIGVFEIKQNEIEVLNIRVKDKVFRCLEYLNDNKHCLPGSKNNEMFEMLFWGDISCVSQKIKMYCLV